jgi:cellobiose transport system substrate-binding protein
MDLSRRDLIRAALLASAAAGLGGTAACSGGAGDEANTHTLWYWSGGLSDDVVAEAVTRFNQTKLEPSVIGGDFKQKLVTTMNGRRFVPDITGIKGENIAEMLAEPDRFIDLNTLGAGSLRSQFVDWKWQQGSTTDGRLIGFPIDIGPTAMFYRQDIFARAGLPTEPAQVAAAMSTMDDWFAAGQQLKAAVPESFMVENVQGTFDMIIRQGGKRFIDENNRFIGDQDHIRRAWDQAIRAIDLGIAAPKLDNQDKTNATANGTFASSLGAAWYTFDIKSGAPDTSGLWRVAPMPGGPGNQGGSFLALPRESRNPQLAFEVVTWLLSPENQARGFTDAGLFPASPAVYSMPALTGGDPFFGGQATIEVFGPAAENVPAAYEAPADVAVGQPFTDEITNVWTAGKDRDTAWNDAVSAARGIAERQGVS